MESLSQKCKKVMFENINLEKTNNLPNEGLAERTILMTVNELKEKNEKEYLFYLEKFDCVIQRYDNKWRDAIFYWERRIDDSHQDFLKTDRVIQVAFLKNFYEFFHEMNSYLNYKLSRKYQDFNFVNRVMDKNKGYYLLYQEGHFVWVICDEFRENTLKKYHKNGYFRQLATKIQNDDFDIDIKNLENRAHARSHAEMTRIHIFGEVSSDADDVGQSDTDDEDYSGFESDSSSDDIF